MAKMDNFVNCFFDEYEEVSDADDELDYDDRMTGTVSENDFNEETMSQILNQNENGASDSDNENNWVYEL